MHVITWKMWKEYFLFNFLRQPKNIPFNIPVYHNKWCKTGIIKFYFKISDKELHYGVVYANSPLGLCRCENPASLCGKQLHTQLRCTQFCYVSFSKAITLSFIISNLLSNLVVRLLIICCWIRISLTAKVQSVAGGCCPNPSRQSNCSNLTTKSV